MDEERLKYAENLSRGSQKRNVPYLQVSPHPPSTRPSTRHPPLVSVSGCGGRVTRGSCLECAEKLSGRTQHCKA